jgi:hypothetical protein
MWKAVNSFKNNTVTNSQVLFHNGSLLHSQFNTQLLITVHNSSRIRTQVQLLSVLEYNSQITLRKSQPASTRPICLPPSTQLLISSSITHVRTLQVLSHNCPFPSRSRTQLTPIKHSLIQHTAVSIVTCPLTPFCYYGNATTHCHATVTVTLLWKCYKLTVMQQALLRYYGNAIKDLICHDTIITDKNVMLLLYFLKKMYTFLYYLFNISPIYA